MMTVKGFNRRARKIHHKNNLGTGFIPGCEKLSLGILNPPLRLFIVEDFGIEYLIVARTHQDAFDRYLNHDPGDAKPCDCGGPDFGPRSWNRMHKGMDFVAKDNNGVGRLILVDSFCDHTLSRAVSFDINHIERK